MNRLAAGAALLLALSTSACMTATKPDLALAVRWSEAAEAGELEAQLEALHEEVGLYVDGDLLLQGPDEYALFVVFNQATGSTSDFGVPEERGLGVVVRARVGGELAELLGLERTQDIGLSFLDGKIRAIRFVHGIAERARYEERAGAFQAWLADAHPELLESEGAGEVPEEQAEALAAARDRGERFLTLAREWAAESRN